MSNQEELLTRIKAGVFTMRDMQEQFMNIQKLGPIGQVMVRRRCTCAETPARRFHRRRAHPVPTPTPHPQNMLPGFGQDFLGKEGEEESTRMMKKNMTIMKSMCDAGKTRALSPSGAPLLSHPLSLAARHPWPCSRFFSSLRDGQPQLLQALPAAAVACDPGCPRRWCAA